MKNIYLLTSLLLVSIINAQHYTESQKAAYSPASQIITVENGSRDIEPGQTCATAFPIINSITNFVSNTNVGYAEVGPSYSCLFATPNPNWFSFKVLNEVQSSIIMTADSDIDFILYGIQPDVPGCVGVYYSANIIDCSYSPSNVETGIGYFLPGWTYYLLVTNFSNMVTNVEIKFIPVGDLNFDVEGVYIFTGTLFSDLNSDCIQDINEPVFTGGSVRIGGSAMSVPVQQDGSFIIAVNDYNNETFNFQMPFSNYFPIADCNNNALEWTYTTSGAGTYSKHIGLVTIPCAVPFIQTHTALARRCFTNSRIVNYGNYGSEPLQNATIKLTYDLNEVIPVDIPLAYTQSDNVFEFSIGDLAPFQTGSFIITDSLTCENGISSTVMVTAQILPLPECFPNYPAWDNSDLIVHSSCENNQIEFLVQNIGSGNMVSSSTAFIYANSILVDSSFVQLNAGASTTITYPSESNTLYTLKINENTGHPFNNFAWASTECYSSEIFSGISPFLAMQDQQPWIDQDLKVVVGAYDPNDKNALPLGLTDQRYIMPTDELEYIIRFQNTGNDTAFNILVKDALPPQLDASTFELIGASHPYNYELIGSELSIQFPMILLPDSATNPEGSIGYFIFKIKQMPTQLATYQIDNSADIYFDFNSPIITNVCTRRIGEFPLSVKAPIAEKLLEIYPNPAQNLLWIENPDAQTIRYEILNATGSMVQSGSLNNNEPIDISALRAGLYFIKTIDKKINRTAKWVKY